jgi:fucose permease
MPGFIARWHLDDARAGLMFTALFAASVCLAAGAAVLGRLFGYRRTIAMGLVVMAAGVLGCATSSWPLAVLSVAVVGCGLGMVVPASNLQAAASAPGESAQALLWLNFSWSIGAVAAPMLVEQLRGAFLPVLAAGLLLMAPVMAWGGAGGRPARAPGAAASARLPHFVFALMLFLYVGCEVSISGWISAYASRSVGTGQLWAVLPSVFWFAILLGRFAGPAVLRRVGPGVLAPAGLACGFAGAALLVGGSGPEAMLAASALSGFGFAPVFPVVVAQYTERSGGAVSGLVFASASLGGAAIPALAGSISAVSGSLRAGLSSVLVLLAVLIWMQLRGTKG